MKGSFQEFWENQRKQKIQEQMKLLNKNSNEDSDCYDSDDFDDDCFSLEFSSGGKSRKRQAQRSFEHHHFSRKPWHRSYPEQIDEHRSSFQEWNKRNIEKLVHFIDKTHDSMLILSDRRVDDNILKVILSRLDFCPHVVGLDLSDNCITDDGVYELANFFTVNRLIRFVNLSHNAIDHNGKKQLEDSLRGRSDVARVERDDVGIKVMKNDGDACIVVLNDPMGMCRSMRNQFDHVRDMHRFHDHFD